MDERNAIKLLDETFNAEFDLNRFSRFVKELFNVVNIRIQDKTPYIANQYKEHISEFKKMGEYQDSSRKRMEILTVKLNRTSSRDRARTMQRNFIANWLSKMDINAALVAFYGEDPDDWRFSFVKTEYNLMQNEEGKVKIAKELTPAKRHSFLVGKNEPNHTCKGQLLDLIIEEKVNPSLKEIEEAFSIDNVTKEFFEKYKELFLELKEFLEKVLKKDEHVQKEFEEKNISTVDFAKKLLGQIVFIYFLQKKGWLGVKVNEKWGTGPKDFMRQLIGGGKKQYTALVHYDNFFNDILEPLFYDALANPREGEDGYYRLFKCKMPFLNGGLFEPINDYSWEKTDIIIKDQIFKDIFDTFDRFNFTVKEDEPLEKEVAVDPEMLGKVFENLLEVKDRKSRGAFYTPREIVHYMCQQSLINYLETNTDIPVEDIEKFIHLGDFALDLKSIKENYLKLDRLLKDIKIVDPAVGSGAFPVGMMNEIVKARSVLTVFFNESEQENRTNYNFKRETIENSLYGVDIDSSAVDIAKLRFWLSLIVDESDITEIQPLPNLDHKIMCGNSLLEEFEGVKLFDEELLGEIPKDYSFELEQVDREEQKLNQELHEIYTGKKENNGRSKEIKRELERLKRKRKTIVAGPKEDVPQMTLDEPFQRRRRESQIKLKELKRLQKLFFNEQSRGAKRRYRSEIDRIEWELIKETLKEEGNEEAMERLEQYKKNKSKPFFLWKLYFSDVFQRENPGFDVVIANPPYVEFKNLSKVVKDVLEKNYITTKGKYDLYIPFLEKSGDLARSRGFITFICPMRFMHRNYGENIRYYIKNNYIIKEIIDFSDVQIFEGATNYTGVFSFINFQSNGDVTFVFKKIKNYASKASNFTKLLFDKESSNEIDVIQEINKNLDKEVWYFHTPEMARLLKKIKYNTISLMDISEGIYQGIATGKDGVFIVNTETIKKYNLDNELLYPILKGKDIGKYKINWKNTYVVYPYDENGNVIAEKELRDKYLNSYNYFLNKRSELSGRPYFDKSSKNWYELWNQRNLKRFKQMKIVTLDNARKNSFVFDEKGYVSSTTAYSIVLKEKNRSKYLFLLGLLNSKLLNYYHKNNTIPQASGFYRYQALFIKGLPIKMENNPKIIRLVDQILSITKDDDYLDNPEKQVRVEELEKEIDKLVYKLYDLTPEEIDIVENFTKEK